MKLEYVCLYLLILHEFVFTFYPLIYVSCNSKVSRGSSLFICQGLVGFCLFVWCSVSEASKWKDYCEENRNLKIEGTDQT